MRQVVRDIADSVRSAMLRIGCGRHHCTGMRGTPSATLSAESNAERRAVEPSVAIGIKMRGREDTFKLRGDEVRIKMLGHEDRINMRGLKNRTKVRGQEDKFKVRGPKGQGAQSRCSIEWHGLVSA